MAENQALIEKKKIIVIEDEEINRAILGQILGDDYDVLFAENGSSGLNILRDNKDLISLVITDLIMPGLSGLEVLSRIKANDEYQNIPVIVASGDQAQEIECLNRGASDFIQKPYPEPGVILARVRRAIELFESRQIIQSTERDPLTGLYNREFFYSYANQYDSHHPDIETDAIILDINNFSSINERYGKAYADDVLCKIAKIVRDMVHDDGGIVCRREADVFQIYCPHRDDYKAILDNATQSVNNERSKENHIHLRMGIYSNVDKTLDIERRFDRAKMSCDLVRNSYTRNIGVYDDTLRQSELYSMRLIDDFDLGLKEKQFQVYYQPKYYIQGKEPVLNAAEGLIRWIHPELGMISPGVFIPLFENNGLIQRLDYYVWNEAARQVRDWKDRLGYAVPVSVNVSRVDITDENIVETLLDIVEKNGLETADLHLEITESAYAEDSDQIIEKVKRLRQEGFLIEMDDFGTGYSSLNMLSTLPIDVLKLDMKFIQTAFANEKNIDMLGIIIEIARHINAPVVAEGVETEEQLTALKDLGCEIVQGYYFSPPVPYDVFESRIIEARDKLSSTPVEEVVEEKENNGFFYKLGIRLQQLSVPMRTASIFFVLIAFLASAALFIADRSVTNSYLQMEEASERYITAEKSAMNLQIASDYLTQSVRNFVATSDIKYLNDYFEEVKVTRRRDHALEDMEVLLGDENKLAVSYLNMALNYSNELMQQEYLAMNLVLATGDYSSYSIPEELTAIRLTAEQEALSAEEKLAMAKELVYGAAYDEYKEKISNTTNLCTKQLIENSDLERASSSANTNYLLTVQTSLTIFMLLVVLVLVIFVNTWIRKPLSNMVRQMKNKELVDPSGAEELRFVTETYNTIFEENKRTYEHLTYGNLHDELTGLYNRSAYNFMKRDLDMSHNALLLVDVDKFKNINDTYGHDVGDLVLKRVAYVLQYSFRATDLVFRLGGDEFVVIMVNADSSMRDLVANKIEQANVMLQQSTEDLPATSLSVGVAFADRENPEGDIFKDADTALYRMKEAGRRGCVIY